MYLDFARYGSRMVSAVEPKGGVWRSRMYQKIKSLFVIFCLVLFGCGQPRITNLASNGENIICLGNSITAGSGASEGEDYPSLLGKRLGLPVINAGVSGDTTLDALKRINEDVLSKNPFLVVVELGGNDFLERVPLDETLKNIDEIIRRIQEQGVIVILLDAKVNLFMNGYSSGYKRIAKKRGAVFVPNILANILNNPNLKSDYIHPNAEGYKILSGKIFEAASTVIQRNIELKLRK